MVKLCWIGLGANLGALAATLCAARLALRALSWEALVVSPLVCSAPWGRTDQPDFLNQVVGFRPRWDPLTTLGCLQAVERAHGRLRETRWAPRTLDLDMLTWPGPAADSPNLILPHPGIALRRFVLQPWAAVAPDVTVEGLGTVAALLAACPDQGSVAWVS